MTLSIHKNVSRGHIALAVAVLAGLAGTGCSSSAPQLPRPKTITIGQLQPTAEPIVVDDEAMEQRRWPQSVAYYHSGTTQTFAKRWNYEGYETDSMVANAVIEPTMFVVEAATYPFRLIQQPPGAMENWAGPVIPPTYTGVAPLPADPPPPPAKPVDPIGDMHHWLRKRMPAGHSRQASEAGTDNQSLAARGKPFGALRDFFHGTQKQAPVPSRDVVAPETEPTTTTSPATEPTGPVTEPATVPSTTVPTDSPARHAERAMRS